MYICQNSRTLKLCLVFVVLGIYYPSLFSPLNSLDDPGMYQYLLNTDSFSIRDIFLPGVSGTYYRPILLSSFMMDKFVWGLEVSFMHLENILFHLVNTLLVFAIARRAANFHNESSPVAPFVAALFFAIHPLNTEAVNWISGRTDLLAGFFLLLAMFLILRMPWNWFQSFVAAICMILACLVKETAIFFLPAALLFPFYTSATRKNAVSFCSVCRSYGPHLVVFCFAGAAYFAFRFFAFSKGDLGVARVMSHVGGTESAGMLTSVRLVLKATGFYAKKLLIPFPLNFGIMQISDVYLPLGLLVLAGVLWLITRRTLSAFFVICAGAVGTSALMIPLLRVTWTPLGERYMYIPSAFFLIGAVLTVKSWEKCSEYRVQLTLAVACLVAIALYGTAARNILWQDNLAFYKDTLRKSPGFVPAQNEIAKALYERGKSQEATEILKSLHIPDDLINRQYGELNKAAALANSNDYSGARKIINKALSNPGRHEVLILQWLLEIDKLELMAKNKTNKELYPASVKTLVRLIELTGDPFYSYRLGIVHMQIGERAKALNAFNAVVKTAHPSAYYRNSAEKLAKNLMK